MHKKEPNIKEILAVVAQSSVITDEQCFNQCLWSEAMIHCRNCPYIIIDKRGNVEILNDKVKGRFNIFERAEKTTIHEWASKETKQDGT